MTLRPISHCLPAALLPPAMPNLGAPQAANSRALQGAGAGMGGKPMATEALHVPHEVAHAFRATAQGIVTRMGQDPLAGLGGEAIEPGSEGMRPAALPVCWGACGVCDCASAPGARMRSAATGAGALDTPPSNTGVNKISEVGQGVNHGDN